MRLYYVWILFEQGHTPCMLAEVYLERVDADAAARLATYETDVESVCVELHVGTRMMWRRYLKNGPDR